MLSVGFWGKWSFSQNQKTPIQNDKNQDKSKDKGHEEKVSETYREVGFLPSKWKIAIEMKGVENNSDIFYWVWWSQKGEVPWIQPTKQNWPLLKSTSNT